MLQNIAVGPPLVGATDLKSSPERLADKDFKGSGSDSSFSRTLDDRISSKPSGKMKESARNEMRKDKDRPQNSEAKKSDKEVAKPEGKPNKKATQRQQAIREFMDSFESEFEIPPTRLVEAMAQLGDSELVKSPETTADAVIEKLGLEDVEADKARAMYAALLLQLNEISQPAKPLQPEMGFAQGRSAMGFQQSMQDRVLAAQDKQNIMKASVDNLNKKFWTPQVASNPEQTNLAEDSLIDFKMEESPLGETEASSAMTGIEASEAEFPKLDQPLPPFAGQGPGKPQEQPERNRNAELKLSDLPPHLRGQMKETLSGAAALAPQANGAKENSANLADEFQKALQPTVSEAGFSVSGNQEFFSQDMMGDKEGSAGNSNGKAGSEQAALGIEGLQGHSIKGDSLKFDSVLPTANPTPAHTVDHEASVKQVMSQAQYLIKKGGGEMKVQMSPEGMGTIHLKVMLEDGKVNMQMTADTPEAKKTIESSLGELKNSLAAHKLSMENIKVDVVNSTSADTATQNQNNMNNQQQRDQTRQFWNQFNENFGSQGRRESFSEMPNLKGYGQRSRDPLQPIGTTAQARPRAVEGKGSGLNLVA